ncbi:LacI family DNA-binding transcriptional regulator [uncultured Endozoicomonas sp.]|uniref:LacI family DNA-binding transcriptional regulator n=1 Tax=uncultured Endozoicomonas sp. TaxID=432652 RepID=UPI0026232509|nr:LacI family DNA-binding transcriptional regulator [uncultured Endozoicomonas sp.]
MASLYDVARLAGVSKSTVSRVINNESGVSDKARVRVALAIEECGYVVNQIAKDLKSSKSHLVGVIVPRISSHAVYRGVEGLTRGLEKAGKQLLLANSGLQTTKELEYIALFKQKRVEGIIMFATHIDDELSSAIHKTQIPVILVGQDGTRHGFPSVIHDDYRVGYLAAQKLMAKDCSRIGFLGVDTADIAVGQQRYQGFAEALQQGMLQPCFHQQGEFTILSGQHEMSQVIAQGIEFDGIFCATDKIAVGAIQALRAANRSPGDDVYVVGVGNDEMSAVITPSLSTFDLSFTEAGERAALMLLELIDSKDWQRANKITLGIDWVPRSSCPD